MAKIKIIYILGSGHSGSTLLDIILGSHPHGESMGEARWLLSWIDQNKSCSCSNPLHACALWGTALSEWNAAIGTGALKEYRQLQSKFEFPSSPTLGHLFRDAQIKNASYSRYAEISHQLYKNVAAVNQAGFLVDSSKIPARLHAFSHNSNFDVYAIHLTRDPRALLYSAIRRKRKRIRRGIEFYLREIPLRLLVGWVLHNSQCAAIANEMGPEKAIHISYEYLSENPVEALNRISKLVGVDYAPVIDNIDNNQPFNSKHLIGGNAVRNEDDLFINPDLRWKKELSRFWKNLSWIMLGWYAKKYGYTK